jgi:hypothetical protein
VPTDLELEVMLAALLDDGRGEPPPERVQALREQVVAAARPQRHPRRRTPTWLLAAAAVVTLCAGVAMWRIVDERSDGAVAGQVEFDGTMTMPDGSPADARLTVVKTGIGRVVELDTEVLPILPTAELYEVWFVAPDDTPLAPRRISAGTFHPDVDGRSTVRFAAAVDPAQYPLLVITAEPGDGDPRPSGEEVLRAVLR